MLYTNTRKISILTSVLHAYDYTVNIYDRCRVMLYTNTQRIHKEYAYKHIVRIYKEYANCTDSHILRYSCEIFFVYSYNVFVRTFFVYSRAIYAYFVNRIHKEYPKNVRTNTLYEYKEYLTHCTNIQRICELYRFTKYAYIARLNKKNVCTQRT